MVNLRACLSKILSSPTDKYFKLFKTINKRWSEIIDQRSKDNKNPYLV